jgi:hypothetical protein
MSKQVVLKFLFANYDGVVVTTSVDFDIPVGKLKGVLLANWPEGEPNATLNRGIPDLYTSSLMLATQQ